MTYGDKCRRKIRLGPKFENDPSFHGRTRWVPLVSFEKTFKVFFIVKNEQGFFDTYISDDVCAMERNPDYWLTSNFVNRKGSPYEFDPSQDPIRTRIFTQLITCYAFEDNTETWF